MAWTKEQLEAIEKSGTNIIVSAGAGSGKTAVLSTRVIEKLKKGFHINELLILTFTNAAAAEMKERIKKNIKKENLKEELDLLDSSCITTFDSFALSIVKKYHYILNIPKEIKITDNTILNIQKRKILNEVMNEFYECENSNFTEWITTFCQKDDETLIEDLLKLANTLEIKTNLFPFIDDYNTNYYNSEIEETLLKKYEQIVKEKGQDLINEINNNQNDFDIDYLNKIKESISFLENNSDLNHLIAQIKVAKLPMLPKGSVEETKISKEKINMKLKELKGMCSYGFREEIVSDYRQSQKFVSTILNILKKYFNELEQYKLKNYIFDFNDIAKLSLKIIKNNSNIQDDLKNSFKEIMVDEYQDTSDIQEEFINLIGNNNVYMVGDIKQSIYRFRNANPLIFKDKYDAYSNQKNGLKIDLVKNFRSREEVLDNINLIFNKIMDNQIGNAEYEKTHQMVFGNLKYENEGKTNQNQNMEIIEYDPSKVNFSKEEIEIFTIGKDIKEKIASRYLIFDKDEETLKPCSYQDFVIIMDRNSTFDLTKKIFEYLEIPLSLYKDEDLNSSNDIYIVKNIINFLIHIQNKSYDKDYIYCFTSIARSFLYRLPDQEIFDLITNKKIFDSIIYKDLFSIAKNLNVLSIEEIILNILESTNFYQRVITNGNIKESIIRIEKITELGKNISNLNYDINDFYNYLEELLNKQELIKFNVGSSSSNSVKIMNIHKSKGLEFPICYFCGLYKSFSKEDIKGDIIFENNLPIYTPIFKNGIKETFLKLLIKDKITKDDISEKIRLFYVALTRAREKIIILLPQKEITEEYKNENGVVLNTIRYKYKSMADILYSIPNELAYYKKSINIENLNITKEYLLPKQKKREIKNTVPITIIPFKVNHQEITPTTFSKKINKLLEKEEKRSIELGKLFHKTLEYIDLKNPDLSSINDLFIKEKIEKLLELPLFAKIKDAEIFQEYEFIYNEEDLEFHGIIDLMLIYDNHIDIIDYKLSNTTDEAYKKQLKGYRNYVMKIYQQPINLYLYSILSNECLKIEI